MKEKKLLMTCMSGLILVLLFATTVLFISCGLSTKDLAEQVQASIEETWADEGIDVEISNFTLVKKSESEYRGILDISSYGETEQLVVNVTVDGDSFLWEFETD